MFDVGPGCNDGAQNHQSKGEQGKTSDRATKPQHLSVRDENDCQILEDGVHRDRQELESLGTRVDHANQQQRNRKPY